MAQYRPEAPAPIMTTSTVTLVLGVGMFIVSFLTREALAVE